MVARSFIVYICYEKQKYIAAIPRDSLLFLLLPHQRVYSSRIEIPRGGLMQSRPMGDRYEFFCRLVYRFSQSSNCTVPTYKHTHTHIYMYTVQKELGSRVARSKLHAKLHEQTTGQPSKNYCEARLLRDGERISRKNDRYTDKYLTGNR